MVEEGDPNRRGAEHDEDDEGWGDVETELELILIEVIVVAPPAPEPATSSPVAGFDGIVSHTHSGTFLPTDGCCRHRWVSRDGHLCAPNQ